MTTTVLGRGLRPVVDRIDAVGIVERATRHRRLDRTGGHRVDDAGRAVWLAARLVGTDPDAVVVASAGLGQLERSAQPDGRFHRRLGALGQPTEPATDAGDACAIGGLAAVVTSGLPTPLRRRARRTLGSAGGFASPSARPAATAVLAGCRLVAAGDTTIGPGLVARNRPAVPLADVGRLGPWAWPEPRLGACNGVIVEAAIALAEHDHDPDALDAAIQLLGWLVDHERSIDGHFSFTPIGGRGPGDPSGFDQRPIEAWTLARACARAASVTGDGWWRFVCMRIADWFDGDNDQAWRMWDPESGVAYDALTSNGVDLDQGTTALLSLVGTSLALRDADAAMMRP